MPVDHAELTRLFTEAMDLDPAGQLALVDRVKESDPVLAKELLSMLDADDNIVTALRTAGLKANDVGTAFRRRTAVPVERVEIPGYRLKGRLGQGGMGTVYSAHDERNQKKVAIKVLEVRDDDALGRFRTEAAIMEQLDHPGIARVLASGDAQSRPYIVMEQIDGMTLDSWNAYEPRSLRDKLTLFAAVCDAIDHAHRCGVVHRDLKPKNVMVRDDGGVAILDFGVAREKTSRNRTLDGDLLGTPVYMCPEQAMGKAAGVDARGDVYSLGVMLYELIAGELPYDLRGLPLVAAMKTILSMPPKPLADPALDEICARALAKKPEERTASAAALASEIRGYVSALDAPRNAPADS